MPVDFTKTEKDLYQTSANPSIIDVPDMTFIMADGTGNPNTSETYKTAVEILYGLSYAIKMSSKSGNAPVGFFEYVVLPLEGLWWLADKTETNFSQKDKYHWTAMIRQPYFVTTEVFEASKAALAKKKPELDLSFARLSRFTEGLCAQILHTGSYDNEPETIEFLERFVSESGYRTDISDKRRHHEIYLNNPQKTAPDKLKTIIRHPIK